MKHRLMSRAVNVSESVLSHLKTPHFKFIKKYTAAHHIFNALFPVFGNLMKLAVFDMYNINKPHLSQYFDWTTTKLRKLLPVNTNVKPQKMKTLYLKNLLQGKQSSPEFSS